MLASEVDAKGTRGRGNEGEELAAQIKRYLLCYCAVQAAKHMPAHAVTDNHTLASRRRGLKNALQSFSAVSKPTRRKV